MGRPRVYGSLEFGKLYFGKLYNDHFGWVVVYFSPWSGNGFNQSVVEAFAVILSTQIALVDTEVQCGMKLVQLSRFFLKDQKNYVIM